MRTGTGPIDLAERLEHELFILGVKPWTSVMALKLEYNIIFVNRVGVLDDGASGENFTLTGKLDGVLSSH